MSTSSFNKLKQEVAHNPNPTSDATIIAVDLIAILASITEKAQTRFEQHLYADVTNACFTVPEPEPRRTKVVSCRVIDNKQLQGPKP